MGVVKESCDGLGLMGNVVLHHSVRNRHVTFLVFVLTGTVCSQITLAFCNAIITKAVIVRSEFLPC